MSSSPLALSHVFDRSERLFADKSITTATRDGVERTTYGAWAERTRRLAGALKALGISEDARVGTFAWNTGRHLELYFAVPCSGHVLHTLNIRLSAEHVAWIANDAEDEVIVVDRSLVALLAPILDDLRKVRHIVLMDDKSDEPIPDDPRVVHYEDLLASATPIGFPVTDEWRAAAMCHTSGTTGHPKGVVYSHRSIVLHSLGLMAADTIGLSEADRVMPVVPMFHVNAWGLPHAAIMTGASLVMPGSDLSSGALAALMESEKVTLAAGVPTIWRGVLAELAGRDVSGLRAILCGGSAVPRALSEDYAEQIGLPLLQAWGMTETSPVAAVCRIKTTLLNESNEQLIQRRESVGPPCPLVEARIIAPATRTEQPWDGQATGELEVRGPWIVAGYYGAIESSQFTDDGWLRTGDVARIDPHGYIRLIDRTKDLVKSGGEWISSVELENEIVAHRDVQEAAVIAVPDERWGERPVAYVVPKDGCEVTAHDIRAFLQNRVVKWWIPDDIVFIDEVPKTSVGKHSKKDLRERYATHQWPSGAGESAIDGVGGAREGF